MPGPYPNQEGAITLEMTPAGTQYEIFSAVAFGGSDSYRRVQMMVPLTRDPDVAGPIVLFLHGVGGTLAREETNLAGCRNLWLDNGWIIASPTSGGAKWGNQLSLDGINLVWNWVESIWEVLPAVIFGQSMGGIVGLNLISDARLPVAGFAGISPVCNLAAAYAKPQFDGSIETAYGISSSGSDYATKTAGHDPVIRPVADFDHVDYHRFYASPGDGTVEKNLHTDQMRPRVAPDAIEAVTVACSGGHLSASHYQPSDVTGFYLRALGLDVDTTPPGKVTGVAALESNTRIDLTWTPRTEPDLAGYRIRRDGAVVGEVSAAAFAELGLTNGQQYTYHVSAFDTSGNEGALSDPFVATPQADADPPPAMPTGLVGVAGDASAQLTWNANVEPDLAGYRVYRDTALIAEPLAPELAVTGLVNGNIYEFRVSAVDAGGGESPTTEPVFIEPEPQTLPPGVAGYGDGNYGSGYYGDPLAAVVLPPVHARPGRRQPIHATSRRRSIVTSGARR